MMRSPSEPIRSSEVRSPQPILSLTYGSSTEHLECPIPGGFLLTAYAIALARIRQAMQTPWKVLRDVFSFAQLRTRRRATKYADHHRALFCTYRQSRSFGCPLSTATSKLKYPRSYPHKTLSARGVPAIVCTMSNFAQRRPPHRTKKRTAHNAAIQP